MKPVEYIQNGNNTNLRGSQQIDLGIKPKINTKAIIKLSQSHIGSDGNFIFGTYGDSDSDGSYWRFFQYQSLWYFDCPNDNSSRSKLSMSYDTPFIIEIGNNYIKNVDTGVISTATTISSINQLHNMAVWKSIGSRSMSCYEGVKIYFIEIYEGDNKIMDLKPYLDNNNIPCLYDKINGNKYYNIGGGEIITGPVLHIFEPSKISSKFESTGGTDAFAITAETTWTAETPSIFTVSPLTGDTGETTVTITAADYTGETRQEETITFTDNDGYSFDYNIRQKAPRGAGYSSLYMGDINCDTMYFGEYEVQNIYLGETEVFASGPFIGLKVSPGSMSFKKAGETKSITIKSSEPWTASTNVDWISFSQSTGDSGKTALSVTAPENEGEEARTATIEVHTASYSASCEVTQVVCHPLILMNNLSNTNNRGYSDSDVFSFDTGLTAITMCDYDFTGIKCIMGRTEFNTFGLKPGAYLVFVGDGRSIKYFEADCSTVTSIAYIFGEQYDTSIEEVVLHNTGNITNLRKSFKYCSNLRRVHFDDLSNATGSPENYQFEGCTSLTDFEVTSLPNIYINWGLASCTALTEQSVINILNALPENGNRHQIILGSTNIAKLTSPEGQAALTTAQNKGWVIS